MSDTPFRIVTQSAGGIDQLAREEFTPAAPAKGEVRIRHSAIGVNFIDVYIRTGLYPWPVDKNLVLGSEAAGVIEAVGADVSGFAEGDRVVYTLANGAYATHRNIAASWVVKLPDAVADDVAAAAMLKGLTASYLLNDSYAVRVQDTVLFHAAAGGVGSIAGQWLKAKGVTAIGTAGGPTKCASAKQHGYDQVIDYRKDDVVARVQEFTDGQGVQAVYDSVGKDTVANSLKCLSRFGTLVCFGQSSGPYTDFSISDLAPGSYRLTRPTLFHYADRREWLEAATAELFSLIANGTIKLAINQRFALEDVAAAHTALETRQTQGCTILTIDSCSVL